MFADQKLNAIEALRELKAEESRRGNHSSREFDSDDSAPLLLLALLLAVVLGSAYGVYLLIGAGTRLLSALPALPAALLAHWPARFACAAAVPAVAWPLYWVREKLRAFYAAGELGAAIATGYDSTTIIATSADHQSHGMLALLAAIYIGVRAFDNLYKALDGRKTKRVREATPHESELADEPGPG